MEPPSIDGLHRIAHALLKAALVVFSWGLAVRVSLALRGLT